MTQSQKIEKDIERCRKLSKMAGKELEYFIDNRRMEKGLGDYIPITIKLAALEVINKKKKNGKALTSDEAKVALTQKEQEILGEIKNTKVESSYDKSNNSITITVWRLPPTVNEWNAYHTSQKQDAQAIWDGLMRKALDQLPLKLPYNVPVLIEGQTYKTRLTDEDNAASAKNAVDGLKHGWLVWDDSPTYVKYYLNLKQKKCKNEEKRITFRIFPYPDDVEFYWSFRPKPQESSVEPEKKHKPKKVTR